MDHWTIPYPQRHSFLRQNPLRDVVWDAFRPFSNGAFRTPDREDNVALTPHTSTVWVKLVVEVAIEAGVAVAMRSRAWEIRPERYARRRVSGTRGGHRRVSSLERFHADAACWLEARSFLLFFDCRFRRIRWGQARRKFALALVVQVSGLR